MQEEATASTSEGRALVETVRELLQNVLRNDNNTQKQALVKLSKIQVIDEYPLALCDIIGLDNATTEERHLASVFLKNYLENVLSHELENRALYTENYGNIIALNLLQYMHIKQKIIRDMIAYDCAILMGLGFWNEISGLLNNMCKSQDMVQINNAVFILYQAIVTKFLTNQEHGVIDYHWFDVLFEVLVTDVIPAQTRTYCIRPMFMITKHLRPTPNFIPECLTRLTAAFEKALNEPHSPNCDLMFKAEILKCINTFAVEYAEYSSIYITPILPIIGKSLTDSCELFKGVIRGASRIPQDTDEGEEPKHFLDYVGGMLDIVLTLIDMTYLDVLTEDLDNLIYCIYVFMACFNNMEKFLYEDITKRTFHYMLRDICGEIIKQLCVKIEDRQPNGKALFFKTMHGVFQRLNGEVDPQQHSDLHKVYYMSRLTESMIYGLGLVQDKLDLSDPDFAFPLDYYLNYWSSILTHCNLMLQGRIIWIGGIFSTRLSTTVLECHFKRIIEHLGLDSRCLLVLAMEVLTSFLKKFKYMRPDRQTVIIGHSRQMLTLLVVIAKKLRKTPLRHSLTCLGFLIKAQKNMAKEHIDDLEDVLVKAFANYFYHPPTMAQICFLCAKIAQAGGFKVMVHDRFFTYTHRLILNKLPSYMKNDLDKAFDIINTACIYSSQVDEYMILQSFSGAASVLNFNTERNTQIDEAAANVLTTLIVKCSVQLKYIATIPKGQPVIREFPQVIEKMLQPDVQFPKNVLGKLVINAIFSLPELMEPHHEMILRNVITSSAKADSKKVRTNWSIFIFICMIRTTETLNYLSTLPGPFGGSALNFIMKLWQPEYFHSIDPIERKILALAMAQVLQNCLDSEAEYAKLEEVAISYDRPNQESPTGEIFNGLEYLYYLLIQCLIYEEKMKKTKPPRPQPYDFDDFGDDPQTRSEDDDLILYHSHPFNIDIINHLVSFFTRATEPYLSVVKRFMSQENIFTLRDLGCAIPEQSMSVQEAME